MPQYTTKMDMVQQVWLVDDDEAISWVLEKTLSDKEYHVKVFNDPVDVIAKLASCSPGECPSVVLTDVNMPGIDGFTLLSKIKEKNKNIQVIMMTADANFDNAVSAYQADIFDYIPKPFDIDQVEAVIARALESVATQQKKSVSTTLESTKLPRKKTPIHIVGKAPVMQEVFRMVGRVAQLPVSVLITGETGTGKDLVARAMHEMSDRKNAPFVALNMAAIPKDLLESELFGHERGAFTGANVAREGRFEQANGGTIFLDEIGDMPFDMQARLLRVLNDGNYYRVGGKHPIQANVRIVAATHQNIEQLISDGRFREDLLYRLNVFRITIPSLRERTEDIPLLLKHFIDSEAKSLKLSSKKLSKEVVKHLSLQPWPGNIRQLKSLCTWLVVMCAGDTVMMDGLPLEYRDPYHNAPVETDGDWKLAFRAWCRQELEFSTEDLHDIAIKNVEGILIQEALKSTRQNRIQASQKLGIGRNTLTRKIKELNLSS